MGSLQRIFLMRLVRWSRNWLVEMQKKTKHNKKSPPVRVAIFKAFSLWRRLLRAITDRPYDVWM